MAGDKGELLYGSSLPASTISGKLNDADGTKMVDPVSPAPECYLDVNFTLHPTFQAVYSVLLLC